MSKHQQSIFNLSGKLGSEFDFKTDFHALSIRVVELIIEQADLMGYRKPKNANVRIILFRKSQEIYFFYFIKYFS